MIYELSSRSLSQLEPREGPQVHPLIVLAAKRAITVTKQDFCILPMGGVRSVEYAKGRAAAGKGIKNSLHIVQSDGYGHAVDLVAFENGNATWGDSSLKGKARMDDIHRLYDPIAEAMEESCDEVGLPIQHGADWDNDGAKGEFKEDDWPHWQMPQWPHSIAAAKEAMERRLKAISDAREPY